MTTDDHPRVVSSLPFDAWFTLQDINHAAFALWQWDVHHDKDTRSWPFVKDEYRDRAECVLRDMWERRP